MSPYKAKNFKEKRGNQLSQPSVCCAMFALPGSGYRKLRQTNFDQSQHSEIIKCCKK